MANPTSITIKTVNASGALVERGNILNSANAVHVVQATSADLATKLASGLHKQLILLSE